MKIMLSIIAALAVLFFLAGAVLSLMSREGAPAGLRDGKLHPCPETPNCVCSEFAREEAFIAPLMVAGDVEVAWSRAQRVVREMGGKISRLDDEYLAATFQTALFRFVDDVELHRDNEAGLIHIRSASRVGRSDLGANRKRVEDFRRRFNEPGS